MHRLAVTSYRHRHHGDTSSSSFSLAAMLQCIAYCVSRSQAELRPEGPKIEAAGRYYSDDQADREHRLYTIYSLKSSQQLITIRPSKGM